MINLHFFTTIINVEYIHYFVSAIFYYRPSEIWKDKKKDNLAWFFSDSIAARSTTVRPGQQTTTLATPAPGTTFIRLVNGPDAYQGRVEVYAFGQWGTICDDAFSNQNAGVLCQMLGYSRSVSVLTLQRFHSYFSIYLLMYLHSYQWLGYVFFIFINFSCLFF